MPDELHETAAGRGLANLAAIRQGLAVGEVEVAHGLRAPAMAGQATGYQERPNLLLEQLDALSHPLSVKGGILGSERCGLLGGPRR